MISDMKAAVYLLAAEKLRHGHTYYICFALFSAFEELTGLCIEDCTEDFLREFFPEFYKYFDGCVWGKRGTTLYTLQCLTIEAGLLR